MGKPVVEVYAFKDCTPCTELGGPGKKDCMMCVEARGVITKVNGDIPFVFREIDIRADEDLLRRYRHDIPTVYINGKKAFKFRVDEGEFRKKVRRELIKAGIRRIASRKKEGP